MRIPVGAFKSKACDGSGAVLPGLVMCPLPGLSAELLIEEADDDPVGLARLGQFRIGEERVPHAVPDVQQGIDPAALSRRWLWITEPRVKSRVPVISRVGGDFASRAGEFAGNTSGSPAFAY